MTRAPVRASLRLSWPKPKVRAPGAQAPPLRRCAFLRPTHEPEFPKPFRNSPAPLASFRVLVGWLWPFGKHSAETAMFLRALFLCLYFIGRDIDLEEKSKFFILRVDISSGVT
jgi:hypothetical protein